MCAYAGVREARASIGRYLTSYNSTSYNSTRPHTIAWRADAPSGISHSAAANPGGGITRAEIHLATARKLFRKTEPSLPLGHIEGPLLAARIATIIVIERERRPEQIAASMEG